MRKTPLLILALLLWASAAHAQFFRVDCSDLDGVAVNDETECVQTTTASGRLAGRTYLRSGGAWIEKAAITAVNAQTGTTYTVLHTDGRKLVTLSNASPIAVTLPQAGASSSFLSGWFFDVQNRGAGTATITPTTSTIDGAASLALTTNQGVRIFSDGSNYFTMRGIGGSAGAETDPVVAAINGIIKSNGATIAAAVPNTDYAPASHASRHQNGGADEVATATPGANAIPKAGAGGTLAVGWIPNNDLVVQHNLTASTEPFPTDDSGDGYSVGSVWIDTVAGRVYWASSVAVGNANWICINCSSSTPSLQQVGNVGRILEADCSNPLNVAKPGDSTTYWKICHDATDGLQIIPVVGGVEHAANKRVTLKDTYDWGITDNDGVDIFNVAETGVVTNAKIDVEGTGNTITTVSEVNFPIVLCDQTTGTLGWHTVDANKPTATCSAGGTNTTMIRGVADFPDSDGDYSIQHALWLPDDLTGTISAHFMWRTSATSGDVVWQLQTACTADNEVDDVAWNTAQTVTDTANGTANRLNTAMISSVTLTGCTAGGQFRFKVLRNRTHGSDTLAAVPSLANFKLKMRRAQ